jgi:hypothetical protein
MTDFASEGFDEKRRNRIGMGKDLKSNRWICNVSLKSNLRSAAVNAVARTVGIYEYVFHIVIAV